MDLLWHVLLGVVAVLPPILCVCLFISLVHMTYISRRNLVFVLVLLCYVVSYGTAEFSVSNVHGVTVGVKCPDLEWIKFMFSPVTTNAAYWVTVLTASTNIASCILMTDQLIKPQHMGINFSILWVSYVLVVLASTFHCVAIYILLTCPRVYSTNACIIFTIFTGILAASSLYLELCPEMPRSPPRRLQLLPTRSPTHSPPGLLSKLLKRSKGLFTSQEKVGDAKEESPPEPIGQLH